MAEDYSIDDFMPADGETFEIDHDGERVPLLLDWVEPIKHSPRGEGGFRLEFRGPREPLLPQAIYALERDGKAYEMFIVPVAQDAQSATYEAIFN